MIRSLGTSRMRLFVICNSVRQLRRDGAGHWTRAQCRTWWLALLPLLIPGCCGAVTTHGDATLRHPRLHSGLFPTVGALTFPEFAIDEQRTFWFRVLDLPQPIVPTVLDIPTRSEDEIGSAPWESAVITLRIHEPAGPSIAQLTIKLAWAANDLKTSGVHDVSYRLRDDWASGSGVGTSYDLEIEISQPSRRVGDKAHLYALVLALRGNPAASDTAR